MRLLLIITFLTTVLFNSCTNKRTKSSTSTTSVNQFEYTLENAHPNAKVLMPDSFYWSPIEETAPFGSDDGSDAAHGFREWRLLHPATSPVVYLKDLIRRWQYPYFDYNEMDTTKIKAYIFSKDNPDESEIQGQMQVFKSSLENYPDTSMRNMNDKQIKELIIASSKQMGGSFLLGQDNAIIGIGFAQLALEGKVDNNMKSVTTIAIKRQLLPMLINRYEPNYREIRKEQLTKMLSAIEKAK